MKPKYKNLGKVRPTVEGYWDNTKEYSIISIVYDINTDKSYISKKKVPKGIDINDTDYWQIFGNSIVNYDSIVFLGFNNNGETDTYTLPEAIKAIPKDKKRVGIFVSFYEDANDVIKEKHWNLYQFSSNNINQFANVELWISVYYNKHSNIIITGSVTVGSNGNWYNNGEDTGIKASGPKGDKGDTGISPLIRINNNRFEQSTDGGNIWSALSDEFTNKLYIKEYKSSVDELPKNALIGDIYGVGPIYMEDDEEQTKPYYQLYINTVSNWNKNYTITKVYQGDTKLPQYAEKGEIILIKKSTDNYLVYKYTNNSWNLLANLAEIYTQKENIINRGDNIYALVQAEIENQYELYERVVSWINFGTYTSVSAGIVQETGNKNNVVMSQQATTNAIINAININELDFDFSKIASYVAAGKPCRFIVTGKNIVGNRDYIVGILDCFSDNYPHMFTQILTTHYTLPFNGSHTDDKIYTYFRSYHIQGSSSTIPVKTWGEWKIVSSSTNNEDIEKLKEDVENIQKKFDYDEAPTLNSPNLVTSGAIKTALDAQKNEVNQAKDKALQAINENEQSVIDNFNAQRVTPEMLSKSTKQLIDASGGGAITNLADDEDIQSVDDGTGSNVLKFANKDYNPDNKSGLGYKIYRKKDSVGTILQHSDNCIVDFKYDADYNRTGEESANDINLNKDNIKIWNFNGGSLKNIHIFNGQTNVTHLRFTGFPRFNKVRLSSNNGFKGLDVFTLDMFGGGIQRYLDTNYIDFNIMWDDFLYFCSKLSSLYDEIRLIVPHYTNYIIHKPIFIHPRMSIDFCNSIIKIDDSINDDYAIFVNADKDYWEAAHQREIEGEVLTEVDKYKMIYTYTEANRTYIKNLTIDNTSNTDKVMLYMGGQRIEYFRCNIAKENVNAIYMPNIDNIYRDNLYFKKISLNTDNKGNKKLSNIVTLRIGDGGRIENVNGGNIICYDRQGLVITDAINTNVELYRCVAQISNFHNEFCNSIILHMSQVSINDSVLFRKSMSYDGLLQNLIYIDDTYLEDYKSSIFYKTNSHLTLKNVIFPYPEGDILMSKENINNGYNYDIFVKIPNAKENISNYLNIPNIEIINSYKESIYAGTNVFKINCNVPYKYSKYDVIKFQKNIFTTTIYTNTGKGYFENNVDYDFLLLYKLPYRDIVYNYDIKEHRQTKISSFRFSLYSNMQSNGVFRDIYIYHKKSDNENYTKVLHVNQKFENCIDNFINNIGIPKTLVILHRGLYGDNGYNTEECNVSKDDIINSNYIDLGVYIHLLPNSYHQYNVNNDKYTFYLSSLNKNIASLNFKNGDEFIYNNKSYYWKDYDLVDSNGNSIIYLTNGTTNQRPTSINSGFQYFDITLNKPIWWTGSQWVDATGVRV